jgi:hypothetical protein
LHVEVVPRGVELAEVVLVIHLSRLGGASKEKSLLDGGGNLGDFCCLAVSAGFKTSDLDSGRCELVLWAASFEGGAAAVVAVCAAKGRKLKSNR